MSHSTDISDSYSSPETAKLQWALDELSAAMKDTLGDGPIDYYVRALADSQAGIITGYGDANSMPWDEPYGLSHLLSLVIGSAIELAESGELEGSAAAP